MDFTGITYKKIEQDGKEVIEKIGHKIHFTVEEIEKHQEFLAKKLESAIAQRDLEDAKMKNIEDNHEYVKELDALKLHTIHMYREAQIHRDEQKTLIRNIENAQKDYEDELKEIAKQIPETNESEAIESN